MMPVPVVALPPGVSLKEGLDIDGVVMAGLVAKTTFPVPVVALPVGVPVIVGLEMVGVVIVGLVASTIAPVPVVLLDRSEAFVGLAIFSFAKRLTDLGVVLAAFVDSTQPRICPEPGLATPAS